MADLSLPQAVTLPNYFSQGLLTLPAELTGSNDAPNLLTAALNSTLHRERWKYSKTAPVLEGLNSAMSLPTIVGGEQPGIQINHEPQQNLGFGFDLSQAPEAFARLCYAQQVLFIHIEKALEVPLEIHHCDSTVPVLLSLGRNAEATLLENFVGNLKPQNTLWISLAESSRLKHSRNSLDQAQLHWQYLAVDIGKNADYLLNNHTTGAGLRRQDIQIRISGQGANAELISAAMIGGKMALDQQVTLEHLVPNGKSKQVVHNIVADGGKCTFNGRIHIHEGASGTDATLANKNLGLGKNATINTKPELEIYTDDVTCAHGATIGQLSDQELFYLTSRGISPEAAQALLSEGFLRQCTQGPLAEAALPILINAIKQEQAA
ncbi:MAG: Fe-S cluster assembly scaffold protein SufB [Candidatus Azotimanducaceae bacterium]|jgi:Fe-S cluster assembly scaffold protein SufB|tara:strand:+ start:4257 stop:5390 length:1134 start_codon:yes stop_codon:yes gene_type:complete